MIEMAPGLIVALMFSGLLIGLFMGMPLGYVLGGLATIFAILGWGFSALPLFMARIFGLMNDYTLASIPLFILMAQFMSASGMADGLFETAKYLFGSVRGGIAVAVVVVTTLLSACTGITGAACVTMGLLAVPVMLKNGYSKRLACGVVVGPTALGILLPPSIMLIVMAEQSGETIGRLFAGTIIPGLALALMYVLYVLYTCWKHPEKGPAISKEEAKKYTGIQLAKMALVSLMPPLVLIFAVLGVLFMGIVTPTEAAASGCFFAFIVYVAYGKFSLKSLTKLVSTAVKSSAMVLGVMIGANCFTAVFMGLGGGKAVQAFILGFGVGKWGTFTIMMIICFIIGMFLDWTAIVMITFPIFLPIAASLGFDKFWFVVTMAVTLQDTFCTPPFGYNLFYMKGCAPPGVTTQDIWIGAIPFWLIMELGLVFVCIVPQSITWLPTILVRSVGG